MRTEETKKSAVALYRDGESITKIAKMYNVSKDSVYCWVKRYPDVLGDKTKTPALQAKEPEIKLTWVPASHVTKINLAKVYEAIGTLKEVGLI